MRDPRRSVDRAHAIGAAIGYTTTESDCRDIDGTLTVEFQGFSEIIQATFKVDPATGYLRFDRGFIYGGANGDRIPTWAHVERTLISCRDTFQTLLGLTGSR